MFKRIRSTRYFFIIFILLVILIAFTHHVLPVSANTITVTTTIDEDVNNLECSLREAIIAARNDTAYNGCSAGSGADIITLPAGTYTLSGQLPDLEGGITINGASAVSTIIEANACNPVDEACTHNTYIIRIDTTGAGTLNNLTLRHGRVDTYLDYSGAINNAGDLTINNCILTANEGVYGGAIHNFGPATLTINNSIINHNIANVHAGGIFNEGTSTINRSSISYNIADDDGGGIDNWGLLTINDSNIFYNDAFDNGGGIFNALALYIYNSTFAENSAADGGGIYNREMVITGQRDVEVGWSIITNSTFSANSAENYGGGIYNDGIADITNSTFSGNEGTEGAGIYNNSSLDFVNTIIANSITGRDCYNSAFGTVGTNLNNLVEHGICGAMIIGDPMIGPLADNGGYTPTHALLYGSPAIDVGNLTECPSADQRGMPRPKGSGCDIGAYEFYPLIFLPLIVR